MGVPSIDAEECLQVLLAPCEGHFRSRVSAISYQADPLCLHSPASPPWILTELHDKGPTLLSILQRGIQVQRGPRPVQGHPAKGRARFPSHMKLESLCVNLQFYCLHHINTTLDSEQTKSSQSDPRKDPLLGRWT